MVWLVGLQVNRRFNHFSFSFIFVVERGDAIQLDEVNRFRIR